MTAASADAPNTADGPNTPDGRNTADDTARIHVLIVDDDPLVRAGLRLMLGGAPDLEVVGDISDGDEVVAAVRELRPDVVLMDVRMQRVDGITAIRALRDSEVPDPPAVIVLTTFRTDGTVLEALRAGASGFVLKHTPPAEIVEAIRTAASGQPTVSPTVLRQLIDHVAAMAEASAGPGDDPTAAAPDQTVSRRAAERLAVLTDREREVALAVAEGLGNADIAARLFLSHGSVKAHISSALTKLSLDNRIQLAILAHESQQRP